MKNILIAAVGMSPQVVTETIFYLHKHNIYISEIYVLTTIQSPVRDFLLTHLPKLSRYLKIPKPRFDPSTNLLIYKEPEQMRVEDINSSTRSSEYTSLVCRLLFQLTSQKNTIVHSSFAGGRKTMSVAMAVGMMLFGRERDTLSHVIASKQFEKSQKPYPNTTEEDQIILMFVPYIRLRKLLPDISHYGIESYEKLIKAAQKEIENSVKRPSLRLIPEKFSLQIEGVVIKLQPLQYAFYQFVLEKRKIAVSKSFEIGQEFYKTYTNSIRKSENNKRKSIDIETFRKLRSQINKIIETKLDKSNNLSRYRLQSKKEGMIVYYYIEQHI